MHVESRFVSLEAAPEFERNLRILGFRKVDKSAEEIEPGEYLRLGADSPENYRDGGITFVWKDRRNCFSTLVRFLKRKSAG